MKSIPHHTFLQPEHGHKPLIDIIELQELKKYKFPHTAHTLNYYDLTFITEGEGEFYVADRSYVVKPRDVVFSRPGEMRHYKEKIQNGYALIFEEESFSSFFNDRNFIKSLNYFAPNRPAALLNLPDKTYTRILDLLLCIKIELNDYREQDQDTLKEYLQEVLTLLQNDYANFDLRFHEYRNNMNHLYINKFIRIVDRTYKENHSIQYYADQIRITSSHLNIIVKAVFGVSAKSYVYSKVLHEAKRLLNDTDMNVSEIASALNYETSSYFILFFRSHTGMTPLSYRNKHRKAVYNQPCSNDSLELDKNI